MDPSRSKAACDEAARHLDELAEYSRVGATGARAARHLHRERAHAHLGRRAVGQRATCPCTSTSSRPSDEVTGCVDRTGERPGAYLERIGLLSPRLVLAHGVWMEAPGARARRRTRRDRRHQSGLEPQARRRPRVPVREGARATAYPLGLGTDGASSNNSLDLLADLKVLALLQKFEANDPAALPAAEAWQVATGALAPRLGGTPAARGGGAGRLPARPRVRARARTRPRPRQPRVRRVGLRRQLHRRAWPRPHARRSRRRRRRAEDEEVRAHVVECARRLGVL